ncbi:predicted protein [Botrytis cinerea T4]|uniref:Uncharacterized protein n=1 Tax=Botryotinia fuckeliana (strain T4) TaxID=999810 RepID=G2Y925_BOTF4|nr:predicted protein [Botrytis cinerea T4]
MKYQLSKDQEIRTATETEGTQEILYRDLIVKFEVMESSEYPVQVNGGDLILKSARSTDTQTFGIESIFERQDGVSNSNCCVDDAIETKIRKITIDHLPHDILMNIFDELTQSFCNPLGCSSPSVKGTYIPLYQTVRGWYREIPYPVIRKEWCPGHGKHLADLLEDWRGLRHYRKAWLDIGRYPYTFFLPRYLSITAYNPSNENCKVKLALQDRYRDHLLHLSLCGDSRVLLLSRSYRPWRGLTRPILPSPRQMDPRAWFLEAKEILLRDRCNHAQKKRWVFHWRHYTIGQGCGDWPEQEAVEFFSEWRAMIDL